MPMYKLTPTFPPNFEVHPKIACYPVGSYHNPSFGGVGPSDAVQVESDPRKALEHKQLSLIEQLKAQTEELKKLLVSLGEAGKAERSAQKPAEKAPKAEKSAGAASSAPGVPGPPAKLDKDAKKEARKAAKAEAVKKLASGEAPPQKSAKKTVNSTPWTVQDDRKTWETNLTLTVNLPTSLVAYEPQEQLKNATLTVRDVDLPWARALAKVGVSRGVSFEGEVKNQTKEKKSSVKVVKGPAPSLQLEKTTVKSLQTIWKLLGSSLGLFSRRPQQVLSASHQAIWLGKAEQILAGSCDQSFVTREASQFLARFDSLSSQWEVCVADIVFRSLLNLGEHLPNNVELWAKKIDALIV